MTRLVKFPAFGGYVVLWIRLVFQTHRSPRIFFSPSTKRFSLSAEVERNPWFLYARHVSSARVRSSAASRSFPHARKAAAW